MMTLLRRYQLDYNVPCSGSFSIRPTVGRVKATSSYASVHLTCECQDPAVLLDACIWPEGSLVRWWREGRQTSSIAASTGEPHLVHQLVNLIRWPLEWKEANIVPLFKKGSRNKSVNYRPVSLTSVICILLETIIRDHMIDFLVKHKLINPYQHGFLKARSCLTNLLRF